MTSPVRNYESLGFSGQYTMPVDGREGDLDCSLTSPDGVIKVSAQGNYRNARLHINTPYDQLFR